VHAIAAANSAHMTTVAVPRCLASLNMTARHDGNRMAPCDMTPRKTSPTVVGCCGNNLDSDVGVS